ncbi:MAG: SOS response-associated peptidase [Cryobacterium sp.]|nr:SOS response-associated peptidase [Cryobacterium sp.]MBX3116510.1 SOS response-associated peptidase [Cryobacterium sp.]
MCGRFVLKETAEEVGAFFETDLTGEGIPLPSWNISPTQQISVVVESLKDSQKPVRRLEAARWSLVPSWSKELTLKFPTFNARTEDIMSKGTWKPAVKSKRAIIPASGYFEWKTDPDGRKRPFFIHDPGGSLLAFAGLYSWWADPTRPKDDDSRWVLTATILTSPAVAELAGIHDRNPVPLPKDLWQWWLDPLTEGDQSTVDAAVKSAIPVASGLSFHEVAPIRGNGPGLIEPVS